MKVGQLEFSIDAIEKFCHKWKIAELSLFGSALTDGFRPDSDIDILVHFGLGKKQTVDNIFAMRDELAAIFGGREIDFVGEYRTAVLLASVEWATIPVICPRRFQGRNFASCC